MSLDLRVLGINVDDDEAQRIADAVYFELRDKGIEIDGVAPVLNEEVKP